MGFYLQVELPLWSLTVGKDTTTNRFLYEEADRILREYGNHPSFCLMSVGNELQPDFDFLNNQKTTAIYIRLLRLLLKKVMVIGRKPVMIFL